jgi:hypothetical protein
MTLKALMVDVDGGVITHLGRPDGGGWGLG